ncbi:hypothetical protein ACFXGA_02255 [Actinosynnema sp. NPDC059335]|uniref:hypothetical protein n=1 Tax=Actinosynnema sp. NPDC059335 TaxID=3346804 RepID=UPI00366DC8AC
MRGVVVGVLAGLVLAGCAARPPDTASGGPLTATVPSVVTEVTEVTVPVQLSPRARELLAEAARDGQRSVGLTVSAEPGATGQVVERLRRAGAAVEASDATIGYVRVTVPVELAERVVAVEGVSRVDVDEPLSNADPTP